MFKKGFIVSALTLTLMTAPGLVPTAEAGVLSLHFGGGFRIGGVHFNIGVHSRAGRYHDHYYRTRHRVRYDGYSCNRACYRHEGYDYHHRSCPVVRHHLARYRADERDVYRAYSPNGRNYDRYENRDYRYDGDYRHNRNDRYDRYDRNERRDRRYRNERRRSCDRPRY